MKESEWLDETLKREVYPEHTSGSNATSRWSKWVGEQNRAGGSGERRAAQRTVRQARRGRGAFEQACGLSFQDPRDAAATGVAAQVREMRAEFRAIGPQAEPAPW
jgi:hypothetical protein